MCSNESSVRTAGEGRRTPAQALTAPKRSPPNPKIFPHTFQNAQEMWLHWYEWWPRQYSARDVKGVVFIVSGLGEHGKRYDGIAEEICDELGFVVFSLDHQGHGLSEGMRKYIDKFSYYIDDYLQFLMHVFGRYGPSNKHGADITQLPRFLLGHSMGGLIAMHVARACATPCPEYLSEMNKKRSSNEGRGQTSNSSSEQQNKKEKLSSSSSAKESKPFVTFHGIPQHLRDLALACNAPSSAIPLLTPEKNQLLFNGVIISGPAIKPDPTVATPTKQKLAAWLSDLAPTMGLGNLEIDDICSNPQVTKNAKEDYLFPKEPLRARWGYEMLLAMGDVQTNPKTFLNFPFLMIHGEKDTLTTPQASAEFFKQADEVPDKKYVLYLGKKHETINEIGCEEVREDIKTFIREHASYHPSQTALVDTASVLGGLSSEIATKSSKQNQNQTSAPDS